MVYNCHSQCKDELGTRTAASLWSGLSRFGLVWAVGWGVTYNLLASMGYHILRFVVAGVLVAAGVLKMEEVRNPLFEGSRALRILLIQAEWVLALWLISGVYMKAAWGTAIGVLAVFAGVSFYQGVQGRESCGCFGFFEVHPWITFTVDVTLVLLLLLWPPRGESVWPGRWRRGVLAGAGIVAVAVVVPTMWSMAMYEPGRLEADGRIAGDERYVDLRPEEWEGRRFGLLDHIDIGGELERGRWSVMFYSYRCPLCHGAISELVGHAEAHPDWEAVERIVLIEMPPYGPMAEEAEMRRLFKVGRVKDDRQWFMVTPTVVRLEDGRVNKALTRAVLRLGEGEVREDPSE
jgi:hypothetical protein